MAELVITLSSIPPRFPLIGPTLDSLLAQRHRASRIELYVPRRYRRFPDWDGTLPDVPAGVEIRRVEEDLGPATKVLCAARAYRGQDIDLILCDDDRVYPPRWAADLLEAGAAHPGCAIARRGIPLHWITRAPRPVATGRPRALERPAWRDPRFQLARGWRRLRRGPGACPPERRLFRRSGHVEIFEGCGGVLVRPDWFDDAAFAIPEAAWTVDDIWLSGMLARAGVPIWLEAGAVTPENTAAQIQAPLAGVGNDQSDRAQENRRAVAYLQETFGIW